jgi:hypothetical protein
LAFYSSKRMISLPPRPPACRVHLIRSRYPHCPLGSYVLLALYAPIARLARTSCLLSTPPLFLSPPLPACRAGAQVLSLATDAPRLTSTSPASPFVAPIARLSGWSASFISSHRRPARTRPVASIYKTASPVRQAHSGVERINGQTRDVNRRCLYLQNCFTGEASSQRGRAHQRTDAGCEQKVPLSTKLLHR